jgi:hypothetical protein
MHTPDLKSVLMAAIVACLMACSGGSMPNSNADLAGGGGGGGGDMAKCGAHPMSGNPTCDSCGMTMCPTEFAACFSGGACAAYVACFCACSDQTCVSGCNSKIDATCATCVQTLTACQKSKCGCP